MNVVRLSSALLPLMLLALNSCHGGGAGSPQFAPSKAGESPNGIASFSIAVPANQQNGPPAMRSVVVTLASVNGRAPVAKALPMLMNFAKDTAGCAATGGGLNCVTTTTAPAGDDTFSIVIYAQPNGTGAIISSTQAEAVIAAGKYASCKPNAVATGGARK